MTVKTRMGAVSMSMTGLADAFKELGAPQLVLTVKPEDYFAACEYAKPWGVSMAVVVDASGLDLGWTLSLNVNGESLHTVYVDKI